MKMRVWVIESRVGTGAWGPIIVAGRSEGEYAPQVFFSKKEALAVARRHTDRDRESRKTCDHAPSSFRVIEYLPRAV